MYIKMNASAKAIAKSYKYLIHLPGHSGRAAFIARLHVQLAHKTIEAVHDGALRCAGQSVACDFNDPLAVEPLDGRRTCALAVAHNLVQADRSDFCGSHRQLVETFQRSPESILGPHDNIVLIIAGIEGACRLSGDQRVERLLNALNRDAEVGRPRPIDIEKHFGFAGSQRTVQICQAGDGFSLLY